jgi:hypothetical protein
MPQQWSNWPVLSQCATVRDIMARNLFNGVTDMTCRNCELWDRSAATNKAGRIMRDWAARCTWESVEAIPHSITNGYDYTPRKTGYMCADDGEGCPCFTPLTTAPA